MEEMHSVANRIQLRRDIAANWATANPILSQGELGYDIDSKDLKIGDGITAWNSLTYLTGDVQSVTASSPITSSGGLTPNIALTTVPISVGGTGQVTKAAAFNALAPVTATGDLIVGNGVNSSTNLAIGANTTVLTSNGTTASWQAPAGGGGITQLTGDVTAGPGSGSQASTVAKIAGVAVGTPTGTTNVVFSASPTLTGTIVSANNTMSGTLIVPTITGATSGGNISVTGGTAAASGAGGSTTIAGASGGATGAGGAGGAITISTGVAGGDNTQNNTGGSLTMSVGHSMGSSGGAAVTITAGVGGVGTSTVGASGGNTTVNAGNGGVGSATGGSGGNLIFNAGTGGSSASPGTGGFIQFFTGATTSLAEHLRITAAGAILVTAADVQINTSGNGLSVKSGSNCKLGTSALSAGTVTVSNTAVTANSRIFLTSQSNGGSPGWLRITAKSAGTSFTITSSSNTDTSTVAWLIVEAL